MAEMINYIILEEKRQLEQLINGMPTEGTKKKLEKSLIEAEQIKERDKIESVDVKKIDADFNITFKFSDKEEKNYLMKVYEEKYSRVEFWPAESYAQGDKK